MAQVHINNITVLNNPAFVGESLEFQITFECFNKMPGVFEWKIIYIGSPNNSEFDQVIECFDMDNLDPGVMQFSTISNPPDFRKIPTEEIIGTSSSRQEPPRSSYPPHTKSKSSSAAATTFATNTTNLS